MRLLFSTWFPLAGLVALLALGGRALGMPAPIVFLVMPLLVLTVVHSQRELARAALIEQVHRGAPWHDAAQDRVPRRELPEPPPIAQRCALPGPGRIHRVIHRGARGLDSLIETGDDGFFLVTFVGIDAIATRWIYTPIANTEVLDIVDAAGPELAERIACRRVMLVDVDLVGERLRAWAIQGHDLPRAWLPPRWSRRPIQISDGPPDGGAAA